MNKIVEKYVSRLITEVRETMFKTFTIPETSMYTLAAGGSFRGGVDICIPYKHFGIHILNDGKMLIRFNEEFYCEFPVFDIAPIDSYSWKEELPTIDSFIKAGTIPKERCKAYFGSSLGAEFTYQYDDEHRWSMGNQFPDIWKMYLKKRFYSSKDSSVDKEMDIRLEKHMESYKLSMQEWLNKQWSIIDPLIDEADNLRKSVGEKRTNIVEV